MTMLVFSITFWPAVPAKRCIEEYMGVSFVYVPPVEPPECFLHERCCDHLYKQKAESPFFALSKGPLVLSLYGG